MPNNNQPSLKKQTGKPKAPAASKAQRQPQKPQRGPKSKEVRAPKALAKKVIAEQDQEFIFRAVQYGTTKRDFPVTKSPGPGELAMSVLAFSSYIAQFCPEFTQSKANKLVGTLWDDARRATLGQITLMEQAPKVWWEFRHALTPTVSGNFRYSFSDVGASTTYPSGISLTCLGEQQSVQVDIGTAVGAQNYYNAVDATNADYDAFSKFVGHGAHALKLEANPFEGKTNRDPSLFAFYLAANLSDSYGSSVNSTNDHPDFNRYLEVPIQTRWLAGCSISADLFTSYTGPLSYSKMTAPGPTEIGHRMFCVGNNAPAHVRDAIPVVAPVSAFALIDKTLRHFSAALIAGGLTAGSLTSAVFPAGVKGLASYLYGMLFEWFSPWSTVAYTRGKINSSGQQFYRATAGCMIQNLWKGKPVPAALAVNLSYLLPCYDEASKRVFYPVLWMDCTPNTFAASDYPVFQVTNTGVASWDNGITQAFYKAFDVNGTVASLLAKYAAYVPLRVLPHVEHTFSLACHLVTQYTDDTVANDYWMVMASKKAKSAEKDLYSMMVLPSVYTLVGTRNTEWIRMTNLRENTLVQGYNNRNSYYEFAMTNGNVMNSTAKTFLEEFDRVQEAAVKKKSEQFTSWIPSSGLVISAAAAATTAVGAHLYKKASQYSNRVMQDVPASIVGYGFLNKF